MIFGTSVPKSRGKEVCDVDRVRWLPGLSVDVLGQIAVFLLPLLLLAIPSPVQGQSKRVGETFYVRFGGGAMDYTGDFGSSADGTGVSHPFDLQEFVRGRAYPAGGTGELGYQFTPGFDLGLGVQVGNYPMVNGSSFSGVGTRSNWYRGTFQLLSRYRFGARTLAAAPYLEVGANATIGGAELVGGGPTVGLGLDISTGPSSSFFVETRANAVFPDEAVDGQSDTQTPRNPRAMDLPYDLLNVLLGVGFKMDLAQGVSPPRVGSIDGPSEIEAGTPAIFTARLEDGAASSEYEWTFGHGPAQSGRTVSHTFKTPGSYTVEFQAHNRAGSSELRTMTVDVIDSPQPVRVTSIDAHPNSVEQGSQVEFRAEVVGNQPVSFDWDFGDGTRSTDQSVSHVYEEPGPYVARLRVSNAAGEDSTMVPVLVTPSSEQTQTTEEADESASTDVGPYAVQLGAYSERANAERLVEQVGGNNFPVTIGAVQSGNRTVYKVWAGSFESRDEATQNLPQFREYESGAFVTQPEN